MNATIRQYLGNPGAYAVQQDNGKYRPVRKPLTADVLGQHMAGKTTIGTYVLDYDKARFIVFDIDDGNRQMAAQLQAAALKRGFARGAVEASGRKGFHVWFLLDGWMPGVVVRDAAKVIAADVGFVGEVFPKQSKAKDLGNLVKLPFGVHRVTGRRSRLLGLPPLVTATSVVEEVAKQGAAQPVSSTSSSVYLPCLEAIQTNKPAAGERHTLAFHFATHLRRMGLSDEAVAAALATVVDPDELDPGEFESIVGNSASSGPICDQLQGDRHCPPDKCVKTRAGWVTRPGHLRHSVEGETVLVSVGAREKDRHNIVPLLHPDAELIKAMLNKGGTR